jgi:hypothetical protein
MKLNQTWLAGQRLCIEDVPIKTQISLKIFQLAMFDCERVFGMMGSSTSTAGCVQQEMLVCAFLAGSLPYFHLRHRLYFPITSKNYMVYPL